jgi:signal transduction histidine kinase
MAVRGGSPDGLVEQRPRTLGPEDSLARRLLRLTGLRLLVLTIVFVFTTAVYLRGLPLSSYSTLFALSSVGSAYLAAAIYALMLRARRGLRALSYVQLVTDQLIWTAMVYISGGPSSGATSLYGLTCLSGAILLGVEGGLVAAMAGAVAYSLMCGAFAVHALVPPADQPADAYSIRWPDMGFPLFINLLGLCVVTVLASYLAERLRVAGGDLKRANQRAAQAEHLAALGRLAAGLAHEIRNPLGAIAGSIELLRTGGTLAEGDRELCSIVEREAARLNDLVGDMLDLSRPRAPVKAEVDVANLARELVFLATKSGRGGDVIMRYEGPSSALVTADAGQLRQVVWNLMRNAIQASSPADEVVVRVRVTPQGARVVEVEDDGPGIPASARDRLFDAFFTTRAHGMGIGLAVVKRILDDHGFAVEVDSRDREGTTIRVVIPKQQPG